MLTTSRGMHPCWKGHDGQRQQERLLTLSKTSPFPLPPSKKRGEGERKGSFLWCTHTHTHVQEERRRWQEKAVHSLRKEEEEEEEEKMAAEEKETERKGEKICIFVHDLNSRHCDRKKSDLWSQNSFASCLCLSCTNKQTDRETDMMVLDHTHTGKESQCPHQVIIVIFFSQSGCEGKHNNKTKETSIRL